MSNYQISAGHSKPDKIISAENVEIANAINQVFTLFRINYHNQYFKAFPDDNSYQMIARLWLHSLKAYPGEVILKAAERLIIELEFLPTVKSMIDACQKVILGENFLDVRQAYLEACDAPHPKNTYNWSHPIVYFSGKSTGWYHLEVEHRSMTFPIFSNYYRNYCERYCNGERLEIDLPEQKAVSTEKILSDEEVQQKLNAISQILNH